jgi:hypothetical protein
MVRVAMVRVAMVLLHAPTWRALSTSKFALKHMRRCFRGMSQFAMTPEGMEAAKKAKEVRSLLRTKHVCAKRAVRAAICCCALPAARCPLHVALIGSRTRAACC